MIGPAATRQRLGSLSSTSTPCSRRMATVMSRWGWDGTGLPSCTTSTPAVEPGTCEQQGGDELAGAGRVEHDLPAGHVARTAHGERETVAVDAYAEGAQGRQDLADGPGAHVGVTVEGHVAVGESGHGGHESGDRPSQAAVDRDSAGQPGGLDVPVVARGVDPGPERGERAGHQLGVARAEGTTDDARALGEGGQHQGPVGQRLAAGQGQLGVHGSAREGGTPRSAGHRRSVASPCGRRLSSGVPWRPAPRCGPGGPATWPPGVRRGRPGARATPRPACPRCRRRRSGGRRRSRRP